MSWTAVDLETVAHECVTDYVSPPNLDAVTPKGGLKDPVKIAESIAERKAAAQAEYEESLSRAALDWNLSRIVALGFQECDQDEPIAIICKSEAEEVEALKTFWYVLGRGKLVGFCSRTFDAPTLIQRSRLLNVPHPKLRIDRYGRGDVVDVRDILTFDDARYEAIMPRSLKVFAKRFGIPLTDDINGKDIGQLVKDGDWIGVKSHVESDVRLTVALAKRIGAVYVPLEQEAVTA